MKECCKLNAWIPVSEKLPDLGSRVLVSLDDGHIDIDEYDEIREAPVSFSTETILVGVGFMENELEYVTHWKPLYPPES